jgi:hypothetical protein
MNEKLKELRKQAAQFGQDDYNNRRRNRGPLYEENELDNIVNQKFAELIVRECADIADLADENKCEWIGGNILTHFGVEE